MIELFCISEGAKAAAYGIQYAVGLKYEQGIQLMRSDQLMNHWKSELIDYLENQMVFEVPQQPPPSANAIEMNPRNAVGVPSKILGEFISLSNRFDFINRVIEFVRV